VGLATMRRVAATHPYLHHRALARLRGSGDRPTHTARLPDRSGGLAGSPDTEAIRAELTTRRLAGKSALRARLERARTEAELPADADPDELARYFNTIAQGMAVHAAGGAGRRQLQRVTISRCARG
jgi:hypothetical protein